MPRRRRKHRPPQKELEKAPATFFQTGKEEATELSILKRVEQAGLEASSLENIKMAACQTLNSLLAGISDGPPESLSIQQSKALELASQLLAADIYNLDVVQSAITAILKTTKESQFDSGLCIHRHYGQSKGKIQLGAAFQDLSDEQQVYALIKAAVQATNLPELPNSPAGSYEDQTTAEKWTKYIFLLLGLLPEEPYLTTGTPIQTDSPVIIPPEEEANNEDDDPEADAPSSLVNRGRDFLSRIFRRE